MKIEPYFDDIQQEVCYLINNSLEQIDIAVAWFTNAAIFDAILNSCKRGVHITLSTLNDEINNRSDIDFQEFIDAGGRLMLASNERLMHNKYCVIDKRIVVTGSYNYTNNAEGVNLENIVVIEDTVVADKFLKNFITILRNCDEIEVLSEYLKINPPIVYFNDSKEYSIRDKYVSRLPSETLKNDLAKYCSSLNHPSNEYVILRPVYHQWKDFSKITKIEYSNGCLALSFKTSAIGPFPSIFISSQKTEQTWRIVDKDTGKSYCCSMIKDIAVNNKIICSSSKEDTVYWISNHSYLGYCTAYKVNKNELYDSTEKKLNLEKIECQREDIITCKVEFWGVSAIKDSVIDFYEGDIQHQNSDNFYHALEIDLRIGRS